MSGSKRPCVKVAWVWVPNKNESALQKEGEADPARMIAQNPKKLQGGEMKPKNRAGLSYVLDCERMGTQINWAESPTTRTHLHTHFLVSPLRSRESALEVKKSMERKQCSG